MVKGRLRGKKNFITAIEARESETRARRVFSFPTFAFDRFCKKGGEERESLGGGETKKKKKKKRKKSFKARHDSHASQVDRAWKKKSDCEKCATEEKRPLCSTQNTHNELSRHGRFWPHGERQWAARHLQGRLITASLPIPRTTITASPLFSLPPLPCDQPGIRLPSFALFGSHSVSFSLNHNRTQWPPPLQEPWPTDLVWPPLPSHASSRALQECRSDPNTQQLLRDPSTPRNLKPIHHRHHHHHGQHSVPRLRQRLLISDERSRPGTRICFITQRRFSWAPWDCPMLLFPCTVCFAPPQDSEVHPW